MEIDKESTRKAIYGDRYALLEAFEWEFTPQGHEYWAEQYHGNKPVDVETLRKMIGDGDTPKTWGEMPYSEKGALLLAAHEGKVIEYYGPMSKEWHESAQLWLDDIAYRIKPEPKRETVTLNWDGNVLAVTSLRLDGGTHRITFDLIDGEPDLGSIRMERV